jgi:DNA-binding response OmpR family regulator
VLLTAKSLRLDSTSPHAPWFAPPDLESQKQAPEPSATGLEGATNAGAADPPSGGRMLIADDEPGIRLACRFALEPEGLQCDEAGDGLRVLELVRSTPYDVVVLDIDMPRMKGTEVCRELRKTFPSSELKIILISGRASPDELARMMLAGADDVINKPFSVVQLQVRVRTALHHKKWENDLTRSRDALALALTRLMEPRTY